LILYAPIGVIIVGGADETQLESDNAEAEAIRILRGLGFTDEMMNSPFTSLSGGWRSRCRLGTALLVQTDLLILDEPSNFMASNSLFPEAQELMM
jgi:ATPase subunit of ABC transporter with duplicated ATPase domains